MHRAPKAHQARLGARRSLGLRPKADRTRGGRVRRGPRPSERPRSCLRHLLSAPPSGAIVLGEAVTAIELSGYAISLAAFGAYNYYRMKEMS